MTVVGIHDYDFVALCYGEAEEDCTFKIVAVGFEDFDGTPF